MKSIKLTILLFVLLALIQLTVPAKMIWDSESVISNGNTYLFKLKPVDPNDPFRGKFMTLQFEADQFAVDSCQVFGRTNAYIFLKNDSNGFAAIDNISFERNPKGSDYIKSSVYCDSYGPVNQIKKPSIQVDYPFNRYYMNEDDIKLAERKVRQLLRDTTKTIYGEVVVKSGRARLLALKSDGVDIVEIIRQSEN